MDDNNPTQPLSQSKTIWGAVAFLVAFLLQRLLKLNDQEAQQVADAVLTIVSVVGPVLIIWGRFRLQKKMNALANQSAPQAVQTPPGA